ncbi:tetratricopeptide repeat protein [Nocardia sp. NPDC050697]|uniref:tetratricopeptide repeat protein n=1 Tax=Nocardia sp. NPDC050697 TaxID=3155158 RepID=UPI0033C14519
MGEGANRFIGVGIDRYADHDDLSYPVAEVRAVAQHLTGIFDGEPLYDPDETTVRNMLKAVAGQHTESMIVLWSGHGTVRPSNRLALPVSDRGGWVSAADVVDFCAEAGASQLLCIIDACYADTTVSEAMAIAAAWADHFPAEGNQAWFGLLVSAGIGQTARDGEFGTVLRRLLTEGPRSADMRRRWSIYGRMISGENLGQALLDDAEWDNDDQRPKFTRSGFGFETIPNPLWTPRAPAHVVEHLLRAARGGAVEGEGSWFTGRRGEVDEVVSWVRSGSPGVRVVTGSAGTGKSAIVGRVVSVSEPHERACLGEPTGWGHADPGQDSVHANVHARGLTVDGLAAGLDDGLVQTGVLGAGDAGSRNAAELVGALQRLTESSDPVVAVLIVDGLDEARGEAFTIAADLLCRIAAFATVIVSTRDLPAADATTLVGLLSPTHTVDLDDPAGRQSQQAAIKDYLRHRLSDVSAVMDPEMIAARVVASGEVQTPFLLARIIADQLCAHPIDTRVQRWESGLVHSLGQAFDIDLHRIDPVPSGAIGADPVGVARGVLTALTWGLGAGLPEPEWACVATAVTGAEIAATEISLVLSDLGRYVVQDGEDGVAVYRLAHQSLADHLRPPFQPSHDTVFDPAAAPVTAGLLQRYRALLTDGHCFDASKYLWRYAYRHAAAAGPTGVDIFRELTGSAPQLYPDLAAADLTIAGAAARWGHRHDAVPPTEEAVTLYRELAADNSAYLPDLASSLSNLGSHYSDVGRHADAIPPTEEAVTLYRAQAVDNPAYLLGLAAALNNLGSHYSDVGRHADAIPPTEEAVTLYRAQAVGNPAYLLGLTAALNNLGGRYSAVGRHADAIPPAEGAVVLRRAQAANNPAYLLGLAAALNNLGNHTSQLGRDADAIPPTEEAVTLYRAQADHNPAYLPDLAAALNNLGIRFSAAGRHTDAIPPTEEAVTLYRAQADHNPAYVPGLAAALINLGDHYNQVRRHTDAIPPTEEAVTLYRAQAVDNPAHIPNLASALNHLGSHYGEVGRHADAIPPTEEAITLYRTQTADNPAYLLHLAAALNNLGNHTSQLGRDVDAIPPTEEAVTLYHTQIADNPAHIPNFAAALINLSGQYSQVGRHADAIHLVEKAITLYRAQTADNPAHIPTLAIALNNLGLRYREVGRLADAITPTEEAVALYRAQAANNPAYLPELAAALNNLGGHYSQVGRHADAIPPTEEAVALRRTQTANIAGLAAALNNLGIYYSQVGRHTDAIPPTEEAATLYRAQAADDPAYLSNLANTVTALTDRLVNLGRSNDADVVWQEVIESQTEFGRGYLLWSRACSVSDGDLRTAEWLMRAEVEGATNLALVSAVHECARTHRDANPKTWDEHWNHVTGAPPPAWLTVEPQLLALARGWIYADTFDDEFAYLLEHPCLLQPNSDVAITEALLDSVDAATYIALRNTAREQGIPAAYEPLFRTQTLHQFLTASPQQQYQLLKEHLDRLVRGATEQLSAIIDAHPEDPRPRRAAALIAIAADEGDTTLLHDSINALDNPTLFPALLHIAAHSADTISLLRPVANLALLSASTPEEASDAFLYLACAAAIPPDPNLDAATKLLQQSKLLAPQRSAHGIGLLAELAATHPAVLPLIPILAKEPTDGEN